MSTKMLTVASTVAVVAATMAAAVVRMCIPFFFRFLTGLIFRNPRISADYFRFRGTHVGIKSFQGKINLFQNPPESGIPEGRTLEELHSMPRVTNIHIAN